MLRLLQLYLSRLGYKWGKKKGMHNYKLKEENVWKRDEYVQFMTAVNQYPTRRFGYMDERYIHKNYQHHDNFFFEHNDEKYLEVKSIHKGRLFCFVATIIDEDQTLSYVPEE